MRYYCNICKKDITSGEYSYSMDKFGRALCRVHQEEERRNQENPNQFKRKEVKTIEQETIEQSVVKKVIVKIGKVGKKGLKKAVGFSKKHHQKRKWKTLILGRMTMNQLKQLCNEHNISTKKKIEEEGE
jgi:hypothetical protein